MIAGLEDADLSDFATDLRGKEAPSELSRASTGVSHSLDRLANKAAIAADAEGVVASRLEHDALVAIDTMDLDSPDSLIDPTRVVERSLLEGFNANQAARDAFRLGGLALAARMLQWNGSLSGYTFGSYGAAKSAVCSVTASRCATAATVFGPGGEGRSGFKKASGEAASWELHRQVDFLRESLMSSSPTS